MFAPEHIIIIHLADAGFIDDLENPTKQSNPLSIYTNDSWKISRNKEDGFDEVKLYNLAKVFYKSAKYSITNGVG